MKLINIFLKMELLNYKIISSKAQLEKWIKSEDPYKYFTDDDKEKIIRVGTSLNNRICNQEDMSMDEAFNRFNRLMRSKQLKKSIVVFREQDSIDYEMELAKGNGLAEDYLYVYTALCSKYYNRQYKMKIYIPAGTNYIFTGEYSNVADVQELILNVGTVLRILKRKEKDDHIYIEAIVENRVINI